MARASTAATASSAAVPTITRSSVSGVSRERRSCRCARSRCSPSGSATAAATSPATNATAPITTALAASTRPRRGLGANVVRIRPRRYSAVMNSAADHDQHDQPGEGADEGALDALPRPLGRSAGAMSPDPVTVNVPPACWNRPMPVGRRVRRSPMVVAASTAAGRPAARRLTLVEDGGGLARRPADARRRSAAAIDWSAGRGGEQPDLRPSPAARPGGRCRPWSSACRRPTS